MGVLKTVSNTIKIKFNSKLIYSKNTFTVYLYAPIMLIHSRYRNDENYYPKAFS